MANEASLEADTTMDAIDRSWNHLSVVDKMIYYWFSAKEASMMSNPR